MQERGLEIVDVHRVLHRIQPQLVGTAHHLSAADAAAGEPHAETGGMVVSSRFASVDLRFTHGGAAELAAPQHQGLLQQPPLFQILQQRRRRLVRIVAVLLQPLLEPVVEIPVGVVEHDEADAPLHQAAGQETVDRV